MHYSYSRVDGMCQGFDYNKIIREVNILQCKAKRQNNVQEHKDIRQVSFFKTALNNRQLFSAGSSEFKHCIYQNNKNMNIHSTLAMV